MHWESPERKLPGWHKGRVAEHLLSVVCLLYVASYFMEADQGWAWSTACLLQAKFGKNQRRKAAGRLGWQWDLPSGFKEG